MSSLSDSEYWMSSRTSEWLSSVFCCIGPRSKPLDVKDTSDPEPGEETHLLRDSPAVSPERAEDDAKRREAAILRELVRQAESKMVNITHTQPFHLLSHSHSVSPARSSSRSSSESQRFPSRSHSRASTASYSHSFIDVSGRGRLPGTEAEGGVDDEDENDEDEFARKPVLNTRLVHPPKRARRIEKQEEEARGRRDARKGKGKQDDEVARNVRLLLPDGSGALDDQPPFVKPLSEDDYAAIVALSGALWKSVESTFQVKDSPRVIQPWS